MSDDGLAALSTVLSARGIDAASLTLTDDGTLAAPDGRLGTGPTMLSVSEGRLPATAISTERLSMGALLGRGGMGEVRSAEQMSLRREVAVKTVRDLQKPSSRDALLREAWVGAALEHPNVAPVHTLARHGDHVAVVMKRIEGTSWSQVLAGRLGEGGGHERFRGPGAFEAHLRVFSEVCRAVEFAHTKGVLHLDLKPENVMLGEFGEVYVLDWGLACATIDGPDWLSRPTMFGGPAGTPAYMAPEAASANGEQIDRRTDVYLLGAVLHELVTGRPPHDEPSVLAALAHAFTSPTPRYGSDVSPELAGILAKAMARAPEERFASATALREAVEAFVRHRGAEHFAKRADEALAEVDRRLAAGVDPETEPRLSEAEVAIEQVRREWPEHPRLPTLDRALIERRIRHAILERRLDAAESFRARLVDAPRDLDRDLAALRRSIAEQDRHVRSLEEMGRELDLELGSGERRRVFAILGFLWCLIGVAEGMLFRRGLIHLDYRNLLGVGALIVAVVVPYAYARRAILFQNRINRRLYGGLIFTAIVVELWWLTCVILKIPMTAALAISPIFYTYTWATLALAVDRRFLRGAFALLVTAGYAALFPTYALDAVGIGGLAAVGLTIHAWQRVSHRGAPTPSMRPPKP